MAVSLPHAGAHVPLAVETRGRVVESVHYGAVAVVDRQGNIVYRAGDPDLLTFTRSALKPLQALPFVIAGGLERFGFSGPQTALLCASHSGEPRHVAAVADMLAKSGSSADELQCGTHAPGFYEARGEIPPPPPYSPLAHNCSGKHAGMLAYCVLCGAPKATYLALDHPLQIAIRRAVAEFTQVPEAELVAAVDGCSAPNYAVPLSALARAYARLATADRDTAYGDAPRRLADWITKIGAEGVQAIGVRSHGLGIAIKVADGQKRGLYPAIVAVLDALGLLDAEGREALAALGRRTVRNYRGLVTGEVESTVVLDKPAHPSPTSESAFSA